MAKKEKGAQAFELHFEARFGERWSILKAALLGDKAYAVPGGLLKDYHMDEASLIAARALGVVPGERVLDMCAAPGGKSLVLALALAGKGELVSNEISDGRRARLHRVLEEHLPADLHRVCRVTGRDGATFGRSERESFDRVLCDVPCGSEAHVLASPEHLKDWGPGRSKQMAVRQFALLCAGFDALKPGGTLLYSTCSLSIEENQHVCDRLLKKRSGFAWESLAEATGESAGVGRWVLPDVACGMGPIFYARLRKFECLPEETLCS